MGLQIVQVLASLPFLFMIFFSGTFSPGGGLAGVKELRYLFPRYYLWCRLPGTKDSMEGCPDDDQLVGYTVLTGCLGLIMFLIFELVRQQLVGRKKARADQQKFEEIAAMPGFVEVQMALTKGKA